MARRIFKKIFIISDTHFPYHHPDMFRFLRDLMDEHGDCDAYVHDGDIFDKQGLNFHQRNPDLMSAGREIDASRIAVRKWLKDVPDHSPIFATLGNHDLLPVRNSFKQGIPDAYMRTLQEVFDLPFVLKEKIQLDDTVFTHHAPGKIGVFAMRDSLNYVCGHLHTAANINFFVTATKLIYHMQLPCLIDPNSKAFLYAKTHLKRPILGAAIIEHGRPRIIPMPLKPNGRYDPKNLVY